MGLTWALAGGQRPPAGGTDAPQGSDTSLPRNGGTVVTAAVHVCIRAGVAA